MIIQQVLAGQEQENVSQWGYKKNVTAYDGLTYPVTFPTLFNNKCLGIWTSIEHNVAVGGNEVFYFTNKSNVGFTLVADASHAQYTVNGGVYLAVGYQEEIPNENTLHLTSGYTKASSFSRRILKFNKVYSSIKFQFLRGIFWYSALAKKQAE